MVLKSHKDSHCCYACVADWTTVSYDKDMKSVRSSTRYAQLFYVCFVLSSNNLSSSIVSRSQLCLSTSARPVKDKDKDNINKYVSISFFFLYSPCDLPFYFYCSISAYDSDDDAMSIKSTKSTKSAMSVYVDNFITPPPLKKVCSVLTWYLILVYMYEQSFLYPEDPLFSCFFQVCWTILSLMTLKWNAMCINRRRSASTMTSPITNDEDFKYISNLICLISVLTMFHC